MIDPNLLLHLKDLRQRYDASSDPQEKMLLKARMLSAARPVIQNDPAASPAQKSAFDDVISKHVRQWKTTGASVGPTPDLASDKDAWWKTGRKLLESAIASTQEGNALGIKPVFGEQAPQALWDRADNALGNVIKIPARLAHGATFGAAEMMHEGGYVDKEMSMEDLLGRGQRPAGGSTLNTLGHVAEGATVPLSFVAAPVLGPAAAIATALSPMVMDLAGQTAREGPGAIVEAVRNSPEIVAALAVPAVARRFFGRKGRTGDVNLDAEAARPAVGATAQEVRPTEVPAQVDLPTQAADYIGQATMDLPKRSASRLKRLFQDAAAKAKTQEELNVVKEAADRYIGEKTGIKNNPITKIAEQIKREQEAPIVDEQVVDPYGDMAREASLVDVNRLADEPRGQWPPPEKPVGKGTTGYEAQESVARMEAARARGDLGEPGAKVAAEMQAELNARLQKPPMRHVGLLERIDERARGQMLQREAELVQAQRGAEQSIQNRVAEHRARLEERGFPPSEVDASAIELHDQLLKEYRLEQEGKWIRAKRQQDILQQEAAAEAQVAREIEAGRQAYEPEVPPAIPPDLPPDLSRFQRISRTQGPRQLLDEIGQPRKLSRFQRAARRRPPEAEPPEGGMPFLGEEALAKQRQYEAELNRIYGPPEEPTLRQQIQEEFASQQERATVGALPEEVFTVERPRKGATSSTGKQLGRKYGSLGTATDEAVNLTKKVMDRTATPAEEAAWKRLPRSAKDGALTRFLKDQKGEIDLNRVAELIGGGLGRILRPFFGRKRAQPQVQPVLPPQITHDQIRQAGGRILPGTSSRDLAQASGPAYPIELQNPGREPAGLVERFFNLPLHPGSYLSAGGKLFKDLDIKPKGYLFGHKEGTNIAPAAMQAKTTANRIRATLRDKVIGDAKLSDMHQRALFRVLDQKATQADLNWFRRTPEAQRLAERVIQFYDEVRDASRTPGSGIEGRLERQNYITHIKDPTKPLNFSEFVQEMAKASEMESVGFPKETRTSFLQYHRSGALQDVPRIYDVIDAYSGAVAKELAWDPFMRKLQHLEKTGLLSNQAKKVVSEYIRYNVLREPGMIDKAVGETPVLREMFGAINVVLDKVGFHTDPRRPATSPVRAMNTVVNSLVVNPFRAMISHGLTDLNRSTVDAAGIWDRLATPGRYGRNILNRLGMMFGLNASEMRLAQEYGVINQLWGSLEQMEMGGFDPMRGLSKGLRLPGLLVTLADDGSKLAQFRHGIDHFESKGFSRAQATELAAISTQMVNNYGGMMHMPPGLSGPGMELFTLFQKPILRSFNDLARWMKEGDGAKWIAGLGTVGAMMAFGKQYDVDLLKRLHLHPRVDSAGLSVTTDMLREIYGKELKSGGRYRDWRRIPTYTRAYDEWKVDPSLRRFLGINVDRGETEAQRDKIKRQFQKKVARARGAPRNSAFVPGQRRSFR